MLIDLIFVGKNDREKREIFSGYTRNQWKPRRESTGRGGKKGNCKEAFRGKPKPGIKKKALGLTFKIRTFENMSLQTTCQEKGDGREKESVFWEKRKWG